MIKLLLKEFELRYFDNKMIHSVLRKMLEYEPHNRPTFTELQQKFPNIEKIKSHFSKNGSYVPSDNKPLLFTEERGRDRSKNEDNSTKNENPKNTKNQKNGKNNEF